MRDFEVQQLQAKIEELQQLLVMKDELIDSKSESIRVLLEMVKGYQNK